MTPTDYWCDFGFGGDKYFVGTGLEIWRQKSHIAKADLAQAANARAKKDKAFSLNAFLGLKPSVAPAPSTWKEGDISADHIAAVQHILRAEFEAAEKAWAKWKPVVYTEATRRKKRTKADH
jgi:hypothetical protein